MKRKLRVYARMAIRFLRQWPQLTPDQLMVMRDSRSMFTRI